MQVVRAVTLRLVRLPQRMAVVVVVQELAPLHRLSAVLAAASVLKVGRHPQQRSTVAAVAVVAVLHPASVL